ncbi:copper chaperone PCu(A)C [Nocardioides daejeonensis]|uniref:copper chaperone PCu(A)C n=1 Tax=Nocardioides daejeonensis TaxID=1046556 RepID=UPI000D74477D|nr:copper chaperone PCu(A)C [Nocardioides daejeonensis]
MRINLPYRTTLAAILATALLGFAACGDDKADAEPKDTNTQAVAAAVSVSEPWARGTVGSEDPTMSAAFMMLDNAGTEDVTLESASSDVAGRTELHEMAMKDGKMVMQQVEGGIVVPAGKDMLLQPGGYHVMLMDLNRELVPGEEINLVLGFSDGSNVTVTVPVKEFTEEEGHYHEPGTPEHTHGGDDKVVKPSDEAATPSEDAEDDHEGHEH